jgi:GntR family transcriptional regulator
MVRRSPTLARQAALEIVDGIQTGTLAGEDGLLPSEAVLSLRLGVSRATLREALSQIEHSGLIVRRHGIGTFVSPAQPLMESGLEQLESIETLARRTGVEIHMGECDIRERTASAAEAEALQLPEPASVLAVERVMMSGEQPIAYLVDVVPTDVLDPHLLRDSFHGSVLDLMLGRGDPPLQHSYTELVAEASDADLARSMRLRVGEPLLKLTAQLYAADGRIVDYSVSHFIPGHFRFHVIRRVSQLVPMGSDPGPAGSPDVAQRDPLAVSP